MSPLNRYADLIGRIFMALIFITAGFSKITGYAGTQQYMESQGVPGILLPLVIALELAGGLAMIAGWRTRLFALALAGFCVISAVLFHGNFGDQMQGILFMKNIAMAGGFLIIFAHGAGDLSLDHKLGKK